MFTQRLLQNLLIILLLVFLALGVLWAVVSGSRAGKSAVILKNAAALKDGLQYFQADQNRYPTAVEFKDRNIMLNYFSAFPPQTLPGGSCTQTFDYSSPTAKTFELDFCLPKAKAGFLAGWNKIKNN
jgi:hypothetical protein